jgi:hypothetical protein
MQRSVMLDFAQSELRRRLHLLPLIIHDNLFKWLNALVQPVDCA